jgi:hypothetical protein
VSWLLMSLTIVAAIVGGRPNYFTAVVFSKWVTCSQRIVVVWKDGAWHSDTEVRQLADKDCENDEKILKPMMEDLRSYLPAHWQDHPKDGG